MLFGIDYLGGANYGRTILQKHPPGWAAGFILNTNRPHWPKANAWPVIEKLAASGRCPMIRVHGQWEDNHQYVPRKHDKTIFQELSRAGALKARFPGVDVQFSPFCELDTRGASVEDLYRRLKAKLPAGVTLVNSVGKGALRSDVRNEVHGTHAAPRAGEYNFSYDGTQCVDTDVQAFKARHARAEAFFFWTSQFNGKWHADKDKTPRGARKAWPYPELIDSLEALAADPGAVSLGPAHIWKSHADQHGPKRAAREGKPVLITKVDAKQVELVTDTGEIVAVMTRTGNFTDGRPLYRLPIFGFEAADRALRMSGKRTVQLRANGKIIGTINPAFRAGSFR